MEIINYSESRVDKLDKLPLHGIMHTESELYHVMYKGEEKVLKKFYIYFGDTFSNKAFTVSSLIDNKNRINIDEIVFPEVCVSISQTAKGFIMPNIKNIPFHIYMKLKNKTLEDKIEVLKQINEVLLKMKRVRERENMNFYVNDFHEGNLIFNVDTKKINFVDIDSCRILHNLPFPAKYLGSSSLASYLPKKYKVNENLPYKLIVADQNSDLYCYALIILNFMGQFDFDKLDITTARLYMEYLKEIGFSDEFVKAFSKPFEENKENEFLGDYLDEITDEKLKKTTYPNFKEYVLKKY